MMVRNLPQPTSEAQQQQTSDTSQADADSLDRWRELAKDWDQAAGVTVYSERQK